MKVVNPNDTSHIIKLIPRYYPVSDLTFELYNEFTQITDTVTNNYEIVDGNLFLSFDYNFENNSKYQIKILEDEEVVYRGKLIATSQSTQDYKLTNNVYYY